MGTQSERRDFKTRDGDYVQPVKLDLIVGTTIRSGSQSSSAFVPVRDGGESTKVRYREADLSPAVSGTMNVIRNSTVIGGSWMSGRTFVPVSELVMLWRNLGSSTFDALVSAQFAKPPG
jgi:hypothetical protein